MNNALVPGKVSVIVPTYNQERFVAETLDSVLAQDYRDIEIIVTDDGSKDSTAAIIQEYQSRYPEKIKAVTSPVNTGISANINRGLAACTGEFIALLGGDDLMLPTKISHQVKLLHGDARLVGCHHDAEVFEWPSGRILGRFGEIYNGTSRARRGGVELWFTNLDLMLPSTMMIRAAAAPRHGFDPRLKYVSEWIFCVEVFMQGECAVTDEVLVRYRRHPSNVTASNSLKDIALEESLIAVSIIEARYPALCSLAAAKRQALLCGAALRAWRSGRHRSLYHHLGGIWLNGSVVSLVCSACKWVLRERRLSDKRQPQQSKDAARNLQEQ